MKDNKILICGTGSMIGSTALAEAIAKVNGSNFGVVYVNDSAQLTDDMKAELQANVDRFKPTKIAPIIDTNDIAYFTPPLTRRERRKQQRKK